MHIIKYIISFITNFVHGIYMNEYALQLMYERVQCVPPTCISNTAGHLGWAVYCCSVKYLIFRNTLNARIFARSHSICCIYYIQEGEECIYIIYVLLGHCVCVCVCLRTSRRAFCPQRNHQCATPPSYKKHYIWCFRFFTC